MLSNDYMLQVVSQRLDFWRDQLQTAFRCGDGERVAECTRVIEEYSWLLAEALKQRPGAFQSDESEQHQKARSGAL